MCRTALLRGYGVCTWRFTGYKGISRAEGLGSTCTSNCRQLDINDFLSRIGMTHNAVGKWGYRYLLRLRVQGCSFRSADLGGRVGWLPKAERVKTLLNPLPFSYSQNGYPGFVSLQVPTSEAAVSADTHAFARLPPGGLRKIVMGGSWQRPQAPGGPGPKPWGPGPKPPGDLAHRPLGPVPPPVDFLQAEFLTSRCVKRVSKLYSSPWGMVSEGGRGGVPVFAPAFQPLGRAPSLWDLANKPL